MFFPFSISFGMVFVWDSSPTSRSYMRIVYQKKLELVTYCSLTKLLKWEASQVFSFLYHWQSAAWIALAIIAIIRFNFDYFVITVIAISLTSANTAGYSKCRKGTYQIVWNFHSWTFVVMSDLSLVLYSAGTKSIGIRSPIISKLPVGSNRILSPKPSSPFCAFICMMYTEVRLPCRCWEASSNCRSRVCFKPFPSSTWCKCYLI